VHRRAFIGTLAGGLLAAPLAAEAQPAGKLPLVGVLGPGSASDTLKVQREPFERGLRELGWTPGVNITIEYRYGGESSERLSELAAELVRLGVDVIVARGPGAVRAARQASAIIPVVMASTDDPVSDGFVKSLARPGGNTTGIANQSWELDGKRLALLKEVLPRVTSVGVLANPRKSRYRENATTLLASARSLDLRAQVFEVTRAEDIAGAFVAIDKGRVGALLVLTDIQVLEPSRAQIVALANKHRLPAMYPWRFYAEIGGLMSYATSLPDLHRRSATFVDRIVKGVKASDLPVEQPTKFELVINLKAAIALGLTIPPSLLQRADQVIE
jgi:putative ABC transport system substrate-binding protein